MLRLRRLLLCTALALPAALVWSVLHPSELAAEEAIPDQVVVLNKQIAIDIPYAFGNISIGNSEIAKAVPLRDARQILLAAREEGTTNLIIYDTKGVRRDEIEVTVIPTNLEKVMKNVQELLADIEGLTFKIVGERVYIQGEVTLEAEKSRVESLAEREESVEAVVTLSSVAQRLTASLIEKEIASPGVNVRLIGKKILLEGIVHSETASMRAEQIARAYYPDIVNVLEVREVERIPGRSQTVVMIVHFVELSKNMVNTWGVEWTPFTMGNGLELFYQRDFSGGSFADTTGYVTATVNALLPRLERAKSSGYARVMENPTVSVKSGDEAHIFAGSRIPFVFIENGTQTVQFEEVGIKLDVTPFAQGNDIDLDIDISVTSLGEVAQNGYQAIDKSEIRTSQYCRAGESIVVGGLQRVSDATDYNRVPDGTGGTGIVTLYKSRNYRKSKTQFLVFITPQIHETSTTANREIQEKFNLSEIRQ
jgi:pilus assembly protein CpaC